MRDDDMYHGICCESFRNGGVALGWVVWKSGDGRQDELPFAKGQLLSRRSGRITNDTDPENNISADGSFLWKSSVAATGIFVQRL